MMFLSFTFALLATSVLALPAVEPRITTDDCIGLAHNVGVYVAGYSIDAANLAVLCEKDAKAAGSSDIYSFPSCVAAATSNKLWIPPTQLACGNPTVDYNATSRPHLNYNVYASIVGDCAWAQPGCSITQQNFVDFIFSQIGKLESPQWPTYDVVVQWWGAITTWTATGDTVPYSNFDDFLHYSG